MLSYRHGFHAGNFADVLKHTVLITLLDYMNQKPAPYCYIDTHAGAGSYSIDHRFMQKNHEYQSGIGKIFDLQTDDPLLSRYLKLVKSFNSSGKLLHYPGSPQLAFSVCREQDRLQYIEPHPSDYETLSGYFSKSLRAKAFKLEAAQGLISFLPPKEKRGLIFIDPSYELESEYTSLLEILKMSQKRFSSGIYALWYPVIYRKKLEAFIRKLSAIPFKSSLRVEQTILSDHDSGMTGSGLIIFNPPYDLADRLAPTLKILRSELGPKGNILITPQGTDF